MQRPCQYSVFAAVKAGGGVVGSGIDKGVQLIPFAHEPAKLNVAGDLQIPAVEDRIKAGAVFDEAFPF